MVYKTTSILLFWKYHGIYAKEFGPLYIVRARFHFDINNTFVIRLNTLNLYRSIEIIVINQISNAIVLSDYMELGFSSTVIDVTIETCLLYTSDAADE